MSQSLTKILGEPYKPPHTTNNAPDCVSCSIGVYEDPEKRKIYFPAAGYTKMVSYYPGHADPLVDKIIEGSKGHNRQQHIYSMHQCAALGSIIHGQAWLVREPQNSYDPNAIQIIGRNLLVQGNSEVDSWRYVLGYVPAKINKKLLVEWDRLSNIGLVNILKDSKGHFVPMITLDYVALIPDNRFARLQYGS